MNPNQLKQIIETMVSHVLFTYNGKSCGIDPISVDHIDLWFGDADITASSVDDVMNTPFFDGKTLSEIADDIEITEW